MHIYIHLTNTYKKLKNINNVRKANIRNSNIVCLFPKCNQNKEISIIPLQTEINKFTKHTSVDFHFIIENKLGLTSYLYSRNRNKPFQSRKYNFD